MNTEPTATNRVEFVTVWTSYLNQVNSSLNGVLFTVKNQKKVGQFLTFWILLLLGTKCPRWLWTFLKCKQTLWLFLKVIWKKLVWYAFVHKICCCHGNLFLTGIFLHFRFFIKKTLQLPRDKVYIKDHLSVLFLAKCGGFRRLWKELKEIQDGPCLKWLRKSVVMYVFISSCGPIYVKVALSKL